MPLYFPLFDFPLSNFRHSLMRDFPAIKIAFLGLGLALLLAHIASAQRAGDEITLPAETFKKLDTFEALNLEDADKLYIKKDFKGAFAAYKAFSFEFPKSRATAYVLLRMGRCLHQLDKRNAAITSYQDVVNYFPDDIPHAAAAMFYIGQCHGENGDVDKQTAVWARMVKDDGYVTQPNSGTALAHLGNAMEKLGKFEEAAEYQWRTAVAFRSSNATAASQARQSVIQHYSVRQPNMEKLAEFYVAASGFDGWGASKTPPADLPEFWLMPLSRALRADAGETREKACAYWTAKLGDRFGDRDDLRKLWCDAQLVHEKDPQAWLGRMEKLYAAKPATINRVLQWCEYYRNDPKRQNAFFEKNALPLLGALKNPERIQLVNRLGNPSIYMYDQARAVLRGVDTRSMNDQELADFSKVLAGYETEEVVLGCISKIKDSLLASKTRYDYYMRKNHRNPPGMEKALAEIPTLRKSTTYAGVELTWQEADLLQGLGRYEEAIKAYRSANKQPDSTWRITDCYQAMKQYDQAIKTARELESVGGGVAAQASLRIADVYRAAGDKGREVDQLRIVLKRYPKSKEQSEAHNRLESYGVALSGGESDAEE